MNVNFELMKEPVDYMLNATTKKKKTDCYEHKHQELCMVKNKKPSC